MNPITFGLGAPATFLVTLGFGIGAVADRPGAVCVAAMLPLTVQVGAGLASSVRIGAREFGSVTIGAKRVTCDTGET